MFFKEKQKPKNKTTLFVIFGEKLIKSWQNGDEQSKNQCK
jgi:hypothetical protein